MLPCPSQAVLCLRCCSYAHCTDEETEAGGSEGSCPRLRSGNGQSPGLGPSERMCVPVDTLLPTPTSTLIPPPAPHPHSQPRSGPPFGDSKGEVLPNLRSCLSPREVGLQPLGRGGKTSQLLSHGFGPAWPWRNKTCTAFYFYLFLLLRHFHIQASVALMALADGTCHSVPQPY